MSRTAKNFSEDDAREIANFLLDKGIPQTQIASTVKKSQSWVSGIKRERDIANSAREEGRQEVRSAIIENVEDKAAREVTKRLFHSSSRPILPSDND